MTSVPVPARVNVVAATEALTAFGAVVSVAVQIAPEATVAVPAPPTRVTVPLFKALAAEIAPVADNVVNVPAAGVVAPIA